MFTRITRGLPARRLAGAAFVRSLSNVLVTRQIPKPAMEILRHAQSLKLDVWDSEEPIPRDELLKRVKNVDGLYCLLTERIDGELLDAAGPQLQIVSTMSVGYDHVDTREIKQRGIKLGYTPGVLTDATANLTVALLLATARRLIEAAGEVKNGGWGTWKPLWMCGPSLKGSTVGIVGYGRIGVAVAKRLAPFGVAKFLYTDIVENPEGAAETKAQFVDEDTLLKESDFVLGCTALTAETKEMFNKDVFAKMKKTAIFINSSRGGVVQQDDLYEALKNGEIAMAGLDVTVPEPLPPSHPLVSLKNCVILPHIGSAETPTREAMGTLAARNLVAALTGEEMPAQAQL